MYTWVCWKMHYTKNGTNVVPVLGNVYKGMLENVLHKNGTNVAPILANVYIAMLNNALLKK